MKIARGTFKEFFRIFLNEDKGIVGNFCCSIMSYPNNSIDKSGSPPLPPPQFTPPHDLLT